MGIFDFLKKIVGENKSEEVAVEKLGFSEIESWIGNKIKENESKEKEILSLVGGKIESFILELKDKIVILEGYDVGLRKEEERIKNIVIDSREKYIESVGDLIVKLNNLEESKLERVIERINKIFFDFNKGSFKNYERATILIGKEMGGVKKSLTVFSKDLLKIFDDGKPVVDSFKNFLVIKEKLEVLASFDKTLEGISGKKLDLDKKIGEKEEENKTLKLELEEIKKSKNYLDFLDNQKRVEILKSESEKEILELKQLLDFKALTSFFHINPEQMEIVKNHREDFYKSFEKDNGKSIVSLLDESKLNSDGIEEKIKKIHSKLEGLENSGLNLGVDETREAGSKIEEVDLEIWNLKIEKGKEKKREEKFRESKMGLTNSLKQEFEKMGVEIE